MSAGTVKPISRVPFTFIHSYMGLHESSSGFEARLTFFLPSSRLFCSGLEVPFLRPGPLAKRPARAGSVKETRTCALVRVSLSLTDPSTPAETWNASERRRTTNLGIGLFIRQRKKTAEPYIRRDSSSSPNPYPTCWEVRGRAGRDQSFGRHIEAMNGPGHTSIPVRRVARRASASPGRASDKLVTPP
jgi:hypothetical protein